MMTEVNVHAARRFIKRVVQTNDVKNITLIHPLHAHKVDQIFSPRYYSFERKKITYFPTPSHDRRKALLEAAKRAGVASTSSTSSTTSRNADGSTNKTKKPRKPRITLSALEKRVKVLEVARTALEKHLKELTKKRVVPLENLVEGVEKQVNAMEDVHTTMKKNFSRAEKVVLRDERMLKRLRDDVKTSIKPIVKANTTQIAELRHRLEKLEAMYATYATIGASNPERMKALGERITLTKRQLQKLQNN